MGRSTSGPSTLKRHPPHQLDIPRLCHRSIPNTKLRTGGIIVEGNATAELAVTREVVVIEDVEDFSSYLHIHAFFDTDLLG